MTYQDLDIVTLSEDEKNIPQYGSEGSSGADVRANIEKDIVIPSGETALIPTGLRFEIPYGYEIQVRPRSGLALKHQITVLNTPGTIDADYRGEVKVILMNLGKKDFIVTPGMRVAQLVVAPVIKANFVPAEVLTATVRGDGGFGHTGTH
jgi:dUTP pyrophosphatase